MLIDIKKAELPETMAESKCINSPDTPSSSHTPGG
jgi:hypothetical protein